MPQTFRDLIAANKRNSLLLVLVFVAFLTVTAMALTLALYLLIDPDSPLGDAWPRALAIGMFVAVVAFLLSLMSFYEGANFILAANGAQPLQKSDDPQLFNVVEEVAIAAGVPMPQVYLMLDSAPNAFATGRDPEHAVVAITTGLRQKLTRDELQGVIAHEMGHIRNYDIRLMLLMAVLVGSIAMLTDLFWNAAFRGWGQNTPRSRSSNDSNSDDKGRGLIMVVVFVVAILLALVAPIVARIIQFAVSRQREYLADASAVEFTRNPMGLANALRKIDADPAELRTANRGTAHLFIANPIKKFESWSDSMFASHPPIKDRIARLEALTH